MRESTVARAADFYEEDRKAVLALNLGAVWYVSQAAGRRMLSASGGSIISIASLLSFPGGITVPVLAAPAATYVHGHASTVDRGWLAR